MLPKADEACPKADMEFCGCCDAPGGGGRLKLEGVLRPLEGCPPIVKDEDMVGFMAGLWVWPRFMLPNEEAGGGGGDMGAADDDDDDAHGLALAAGCRGWENWVADGVNVLIWLRSGVTVRKDGCGLEAVGLGVDQENWGDVTGGEGAVGAAAAGAGVAVSQLESMGLLGCALLDFPLTRRSKSSSADPFVASN
jgi:hypothetical protein